MKILLTADPELPVPPTLYGGIERIVDALVKGLVAKGHAVTLCAHPDSKVPCKLVPWRGAKSQHSGDTLKNAATLASTVLTGGFDVAHSFSRLAYLTAIMPLPLPKIMSYQREPSTSQVTKAVRLSYHNSLQFTGCSGYIANQIKPYAQATTIYNCTSFNAFELAPEVAADAPLVFLGRVEDIKGVREAVLIAQQTEKKLVIAGNIPPGKEKYFNEQIAPHLTDRITYAGAVNDVQKNELLQRAAALLMPIQWNEPFGIVMVEAMACGTPVIGLGRGAVPEVVEDGVTGKVCGSLDEMIAAVAALSTINRTMVRQRAEIRFSEDVIVTEYEGLYREAIAQRKTKKVRS